MKLSGVVKQVTGEYRKAKQVVTSLAASSRYGVWNNLGLEIDKVRTSSHTGAS